MSNLKKLENLLKQHNTIFIKYRFIKFKWNTDRWMMVLILLTLVAFIYLVSGFVFGNFNGLSERGDFVAGIASFLAFTWLVAALFMQRRELVMQRKTLEHQIKELELQRTEMIGTREALEQQSIINKKQLFESTFFSMLRMLENISSSVRYETTEHQFSRSGPLKKDFTYEGVDAIKNIFKEEFEKPLYFENNFPSPERFDDRAALQYIKATYYNFWDKPGGKNMHAKLAHYFRYLYRFLLYIKDNEKDVDAKFYSKLLRAQLSDYELAVIFFNCLHDYGKNLVHLVKEYKLLENMSENILIQHDLNTLDYAMLADKLKAESSQVNEIIHIFLQKKLKELNGDFPEPVNQNQ